MRRMLPLALIFALAAGCSGTPATIDVSGAIAIAPAPGGWTGSAGEPCRTGSSSGHSDLKEGAQVVISDAAAKTIAIGQLAAGVQDGAGGCRFAFRVTKVPDGQGFYGIEVTHRGRLQYTAEQMKKPIELAL